ncbi:hypothetical protein [Actinophytocola gossypii]|uniref:Transposase n=1 Tax=Actinophytocola gossypii TaxID=2812003 RepID=A0ABT2JHY8_9PSEU|nr:hypothetical protein [Actinophytocola gossypii]MCT2586854.1 hypothetical protein [Actinophytocola gossypii]
MIIGELMVRNAGSPVRVLRGVAEVTVRARSAYYRGFLADDELAAQNRREVGDYERMIRSPDRVVRCAEVGAARSWVWEFNERARHVHRRFGWVADGHCRPGDPRIGTYRMLGYRLTI